MEIEIEIEEARRRWSDLMNQVARGVRVVLLRDGRPVGALISAADYRFLKQHRALMAEPTGLPN